MRKHAFVGVAVERATSAGQTVGILANGLLAPTMKNLGPGRRLCGQGGCVGQSGPCNGANVCLGAELGRPVRHARKQHRGTNIRLVDATDFGLVPDSNTVAHMDENVLRRSRGTVKLSNPRAIFAGSPPRFTRSRVTYEAYVVSRTSTRPQVDSALDGGAGGGAVRRG